MSQKYHVKPNGTVGVCKAERGRCPYQSAPHFNSEQEAQNYVNKQNEREFGLLGIHKQQSSETYIKNIENFEEDIDKIKKTAKATEEELKMAYKENRISDYYYWLSRLDNDNNLITKAYEGLAKLKVRHYEQFLDDFDK